MAITMAGSQVHTVHNLYISRKQLFLRSCHFHTVEEKKITLPDDNIGNK
jgi:hypothetical protein